MCSMRGIILLKNRGIFIIQVFFVIFLFACSQKALKDSRFENLIIDAQKNIENGNYSKALILIKDAIKLDSSQSIAFLVRGKINSLLENDSSAIKDYTKAIHLNPQNTSAYFHQGVSYSLMDRDDLAINCFNEAIRTKTEGSLIFETSNNDLLIFERQIDVTMPALRFYRGKSFYNLKRDSLSLEDFLYCINTNYNKSNSLLYAGVLLLNKGVLEKGCLYLREAYVLGNEDAKRYISKFCKSTSN